MEELIQPELEKGESMEEQLRLYFLQVGFYAVRGMKLKHAGFDVTDVDLWLYHRGNAISRERINVDLKNRTKPMAVERVIVAKGLRDILDTDRCIVATTDKRNDVVEFGEKHGVIVLNGNFLQSIKSLTADRFSEEIFQTMLKKELYRFTANWFARLEVAKSRLLGPLDFTAANEVLQDIEELLAELYSRADKQNSFIRLLYLFISHLLIVTDYISKGLVFLDPSAKLKVLDEGFRYGTTGEGNVKDRMQALSRELGQPLELIKRSSQSYPAEILREYFGKPDNEQRLFDWAKQMENLAFSKSLIKPSKLPPELKATIGMLCDLFKIDRKHILTIS